MESTFWNAYARIYDLMTLNPPYQKMMNRIVALIPSSSKDILDAGCGTGNLGIYMQKNKRLNDARIVFADSSTSMLARAKSKLSLKKVSIEKIDLNSKLPFPSKKFDSVVSINTLYSVNDPKATLEEFYRIMNPNSLLILVNPNSKATISTFFKDLLASVSGIKKIYIFLINIPLLLFNIFIGIKAGKREYHFWDDDKWYKILKDIGFSNLQAEDIYIRGRLIYAYKK